VDHLVGYPEHETAASVLADASDRSDVLESRCQELPRFLETTQDPGVDFEWSR
jgi:hypothetical protein